MKTSKRFLALMLSALMIFSVVFIPGADLSSLFSIEADAADEPITLGGITQQRVVSNYESIYRQYQERFFTGAESNEPTNFVIPGLSSSNDYTPQGMTYWEEKEWILISAYDASGAGKHSVIYALDAASTEFVALFKILNADGSVNTSHGGGIAASKYNFYYADTASKISYIPLSEMNVAPGTVKEIRLKGSIDCKGELGGAATSYCCYEDGVLWAGNFYYSGDDSYKTSAHSNSDSMIVGYELHGNSSVEEWYYLSTNYNLIKLNTDSTSDQTSGNMTFRTYNTDGANAEVRGTISTDTALGEVTYNFCTLNLTEGKKYKIEFVADNRLSDLYMFAPNGTHCNVKQSNSSTITDLGNGKYHYQMIFTAGLKPTGADSSWPTTQSTNGTYTGTYTMRFDQDSVPAGGRTFNMTDISVTEYVEPGDFTPNSNYEGTGCAGNPTYVIMFPGIDKIQYAMVFKGKIYISRSWKRTDGNNHTRELMIGDIDIAAPGANTFSINGRNRPCHVLSVGNMTRFGGDNGMGNDALNKMFFMGEALCVIEDYLYMFGEGAAWNYNGKDSGNKCPEPIDVIWKIDQHFILNEKRVLEDTIVDHYEKVTDISQINSEDEYIMVHKSPIKDPVTQKNILYAIDAFGGYNGKKLPKQDSGTQANTGDSMGIVGYPISNYSIDENNENIIYLSEEDSSRLSIRWQLETSNVTDGVKANISITNKDLYYSKNKYLYFGSRLFAMTTDKRTNRDRLMLEEFDASEGNFVLYYAGGENKEIPYYIWCNDGSNQSYINAYTEYYSNHGKTGYVPGYHGIEEVAGTFHGDAFHNQSDNNTGTIMGAIENYEMGSISIYKRVNDEYSTTFGSRVYTDMFAELQADGTYTIDIESYAISNLQYQKVDERPTDFIFVLDASGSMTNNEDCSGYIRYGDTNTLSAYSVAGNSNNVGDTDATTGSTGNIYIQDTNGVFHQLYVDSSKRGDDGSWISHKYYKHYYLYYKVGNTTYWWVPKNITEPSAGGIWSTTKPSESATMKVFGNSDGARAGGAIYKGVHFEKSSSITRLQAMQNALDGLTYKIASEASKTGLDHRIAIVQFGSSDYENDNWLNTGMYTNSSTSLVQFKSGSQASENKVTTDTYRNAFYSASNFSQVRTIINNIKTDSGDPDTFSNYGLQMARYIVANSDANYLADGNRSSCIIMITDGVPGLGGDQSEIANVVANDAITQSHYAKENGSYIYTVQMGNNSMDGFNMNNYMDYVSSEFIDSTSMSQSGDRNVADIEYRIDVPTGSSFDLNKLVDAMFNSITKNSTNAMVKLDANSVLREQVTDAFDISKATIEAYTAPCKYDGIGRLGFEEEKIDNSVTIIKDELKQNIVKSTGFDYTERYIGKSHPGDKLIIRLTGVEANENAELLNTSINVHNTTAIYENENNMINNKPFKKFPTASFTIPEYTYVFDYGIGMYDFDINGKLLSVDSEPRKQSTYSTNLTTENIGMNFTNDNLDMIYNVLPHADGNEATSRGYCLIQRDDGTYDWFRINILPASNVYYEEFNGTNIANDGYVKWEPDNANQKTFYQELTGENDIYGYDKNYLNDKSAFSYGSAYKSEVSAENGKNRSEKITFDYTGTAVDIVASCGKETGIYIVTIKNGSSVEKVYIVDTYFTDSDILQGVTQLNQVPIIHHENKDAYDGPLYGTHTVEITSVYLSSMIGARNAASTMSLRGSEDISYYTTDITEEAKEAILVFSDMEYLLDEDIEVIFFDENSVLNGGTGVEGASDVNAYSTFAMRAATEEPERNFTTLKNYFDGFRVYNALADNTFSYVKSEQGATYYNVINSLATGNSFITSGSGDNFIGYLVGNDEAEITFSDYKNTSAPTNEVYLANNNSAISFYVPQGYQKLMVSLRAVTGEPKAKIGGKDLPSQFSIISSTEMYYDITSLVGDDGLVTIQNSGSGILAVNNIKVVNGALMPIMMSMMPRARMMMAAPAEDYDPNVPEETIITPPENDNTIVNPDPDLDVEGEIPEYIPEENVNDSDNILNIFEDILAEIKSFFDMIIRFFKTLFA